MTDDLELPAVSHPTWGRMLIRVARFRDNGALAIDLVADDDFREPIDTVALNLKRAAEQLLPLQFFVRQHRNVQLLGELEPQVFVPTALKINYGFGFVAEVWEVAGPYRQAFEHQLAAYDLVLARRLREAEGDTDDSDETSMRPA